MDKELTLYGFAHLSNICEWYYDVYKKQELLYAPLSEAADYDMCDLEQLEKFIASAIPDRIHELVSHILEETGLSRLFPKAEEKLLLYSVHYLLLELTDDALRNLMQRMERLFTKIEN